MQKPPTLLFYILLMENSRQYSIAGYVRFIYIAGAVRLLLTQAVVKLLRTRLQQLMLKQSVKLPICFNMPVYSAKIIAIFRGIFEATQFQSNLLQHHMTISARSASNYLDSPLFAFATLDCQRLASAPSICTISTISLQSQTIFSRILKALAHKGL